VIKAIIIIYHWATRINLIVIATREKSAKIRTKVESKKKKKIKRSRGRNEEKKITENLAKKH